ncbi:MAG: carboxymuconolactone decarboxylase family protein [Flavobacteriaceae bacterium]|nr:carboxymuconolactone decarboxylase family protein [Flavobacteriaceae bacterium]
MAHISVSPEIPGIRSLALFRPETGKPLYALAQVLLRGPSTLTAAERELIAAYVSSLNRCRFCTDSHAAAARSLFGNEGQLVSEVLEDIETAKISSKMRTLLRIAEKVQQSGKAVAPQDIELAREEGATDRELHDTVLIAATFCMFNRYVDGLATWTPTDPKMYEGMGERLAVKGYVLNKNS